MQKNIHGGRRLPLPFAHGKDQTAISDHNVICCFEKPDRYEEAALSDAPGNDPQPEAFDTGCRATSSAATLDRAATSGSEDSVL